MMRFVMHCARLARALRSCGKRCQLYFHLPHQLGRRFLITLHLTPTKTPTPQIHQTPPPHPHAPLVTRMATAMRHPIPLKTMPLLSWLPLLETGQRKEEDTIPANQFLHHILQLPIPQISIKWRKIHQAPLYQIASQYHKLLFPKKIRKTSNCYMIPTLSPMSHALLQSLHLSVPSG